MRWGGLQIKAHWRDHEAEIQKVLGLSSTIASGAKYHDPGDAADHDRDSPFPLIADCKCTERGSYSLNRKALAQWADKAAEVGKRFILPVRFWSRDTCDDYVVVSLHDFAELLYLARRHGNGL